MRIVSSKPADWDKCIPQVLESYNMRIHSSHGHTPFYVVYGADPIRPWNVLFQTPHQNYALGLSDEGFINLQAQHFYDIDKIVMQEVNKSKDAQQKAYNKNHAQQNRDIFKAGDVILTKNHQRVGLQPLWIKPARIIQANDQNLHIKDMQSGKTSFVNKKNAKLISEQQAEDILTQMRGTTPSTRSGRKIKNSNLLNVIDYLNVYATIQGLPATYLTFNNSQIKLIFDSGASISIINQTATKILTSNNLINHIASDNKAEILGISQVNCATGNTVHTSFYIQNLFINHKFTEILDCGSHSGLILIGQDLMRSWQTVSWSYHEDGRAQLSIPNLNVCIDLF